MVLEGVYRDYIAALNARRFEELGRYVHDRMTCNGNAWSLAQYRELLERDARTIPDLRYGIDALVVDEGQVAAVLRFECHPVGDFLGQRTDGRLLIFAEHVLYRFEGGRIAEVRSLLDAEAVRRQLAAPR